METRPTQLRSVPGVKILKFTTDRTVNCSIIIVVMGEPKVVCRAVASAKPPEIVFELW